jgi:hypothetical protein
MCIACPSTENVKKFGNDSFCKKCIEEEGEIAVCGECGNSNEDTLRVIGDVEFCEDCRGVETFKYMEWKDGK